MIVQSSNIVDVRSYPALNRLVVLFKNAATYQVDGIPEEKAQKFIKAESPGSYYAREVGGNPAYQIKHVPTLCDRCGGQIVKGHKIAFVDVAVVYEDGTQEETRRAVHEGCLSVKI